MKALNWRTLDCATSDDDVYLWFPDQPDEVFFGYRASQNPPAGYEVREGFVVSEQVLSPSRTVTFPDAASTQPMFALDAD